MVVDYVNPTFSIPAAAKMYQISVDGGKTYQDVVSEEKDENGNTVEKWIEIDYYALNKMSHEADEDVDENFTFGIHANPIALKFRRKTEYDGDNDVYKGLKVYKILVNDVSVFDEDDLGENVLETGTQKQGEEGNYLSGRYAAYVDQNKKYGDNGYTVGVTSGGLNFSDFKIEAIKNTQMQMVFYVRGLVYPIRVKGGRYHTVSPEGCWVNIYVTNGGGDTFTTRETTVYAKQGAVNLSIRVRVDWSFHNGYSQTGEYGFQYQFTKLDVLGYGTAGGYGAHDAVNTNYIKIKDIVWTADPEIHVTFTDPAGCHFTGKADGGDTHTFWNLVLDGLGND